MMKEKLDKQYIGLIAGIFVPLLILLFIYLLKYANHYTAADVYQQITQLGLLSRIMSLCVFLSNLSIFYVFYRLKMNWASRGVLLATFLYVFAMLIAKIL